MDTFQKAVEEDGNQTYRLQRSLPDDRDTESVRFATMHRVKGLEFKAVIIVDVVEGKVPSTNALNSSEDPVEQQLQEQCERSLLHVACTRAAQRLSITFAGEKRRFSRGNRIGR